MGRRPPPRPLDRWDIMALVLLGGPIVLGLAVECRSWGELGAVLVCGLGVLGLGQVVRVISERMDED